MSETNTEDNKRQPRLSQTDVPGMELEKALRLARCLWDDFAGKAARPIQLAEALDTKPSSGGWRGLTGASIAYGLTEGGYNAQEIKLTELGRRIVAPREDGDDSVAAAQAALLPRVCKDFLTRYDGARFPSEKIAASVLVDLGVPKERTERVVGILLANAKFVGVLRTIKGENYVALETAKLGASAEPQSDNFEDAPPSEEPGKAERETPVPPAVRAEPVQTGPKKIFVAHGKRHDALDAVKRVLDRFKVPYVVAVDEPNAGRPISEKVAGLMKECSAGIFVFTPDETFKDANDKELHRPSENVIYELGAASVLWGRKIVILKEASVNFASDYRDIGYIEFSMDNPRSIGTELLTELIALDFLKIQVAN
ncbi:TIR domain-containing protein [Brevundimonas aveniformis]|uniref:TIR domain-containing protein n=1 Tax=Brevundimonas aveniformis TaxID=370977 RepID=UPI0009FF9617|nr:TIR domain-containing protein [Brevundimonas aveniformis]